MRVTHSAKANAVGEIACVAMPPWSSRVSVHAVLAIMVGFACGSAHGQTWGTNTTGTWATGANWVGSSAPATTGTATFASTNAARTITLGADTTIAGLVFTNTNSTSFVNDGTLRTLSIGAAGITLNGTSGAVALGSAGNPLNVVVSAGQSYTNNSASALTITGTISRTAADATARTLTVTGAGNTVFTGNMVNSGGLNGLALTKSGAGTLTFNGSGTSTFTGATTLSGGQIAIDFVNSLSGTNVFTASSAVTFSGGSMAIKGKASGATSQSLTSTAISGSVAASILVDPNGGTSTTVNLGGLTTSVGSSLLIGRALGSGAGTLTMTTTTSTAANGIYVRTIYADGTANTGYDFATSSAGTPRTLSGFSGYSSLPSSGVNTNVSQISAGLSLSGDVTTNTLKVAAPATGQSLAIGGNLLTLTGGGLLVTGSNNFEISGAAGGTRLTTGSGNGTNYELLVHQYSSGTTTISAVIGDNGANAVALTKAGPGTLVASASNTYTGPTVIAGGVLAAGVSGGAFGSNSTVTVAGGGTLRLGGFANSIASLSGTTGNVLENASATAATLTVGNSTNTVFSGLIQDGAGGGAFSLTKVGSGQLQILGANTFTGGVTITAGTLSTFQSGFALGTGTITLNGGVLSTNLGHSNPILAAAATVSTIAYGGNNTFSGPLLGSGTIFVTGATSGNAFSQLGDTSAFQGEMTMTRGTVIRRSTSGSLSQAIVNLIGTDGTVTWNRVGGTDEFGSLSGNAASQLGGASGNTVNTFIIGGLGLSTEFAGTITNNTASGGNFAVSLTKTGAGVLTLSGSNSNTGPTTGSAGVLRLNSQFALSGGLGSGISGSSSALTIAGGVIGLGFDDFLRPLGTGSNAVQWTGAGGFAAYTADRTVNLGGASAGVTWASGNFVPNGSALILSHTTANKTVTFLNPIALNGATRVIDVQDGTAAVDAVVSGAISGGASDGLTKNGAGWLALTGINTYGGMTTVNAGGLAMNGSLAGAVTVQAGGILGGSGTIEGPVSILDGGIIAPGNSPATLTVNDVFTLGSTSILDFELSGSDQTVGGGVNDLISGVTDLTLDGILNVTALTSFTSATAGMKWRLFSYSGALTNNTLSLGSMPTLSAGNSFSIDTSQTGQVNLVIVPEPAGWLIAAVGIGVAGLTLAKRKRIAADRRHG